jgi:hypothetical protein
MKPPYQVTIGRQVIDKGVVPAYDGVHNPEEAAWSVSLF